MSNPKRFTYWTADGKRHWTPFIGLAVPANVELVPADDRYACRSRSQLILPTRKQDDHLANQERAPHQRNASSDSADTLPRNTNPPL